MPRTPRERSSGTKWAAPAEDPEDKENFTLDSPHTQAKKFRFEEETPAATNGGDGDFWGGKSDASAPLPQAPILLLLVLCSKEPAGKCRLPKSASVLFYCSPVSKSAQPNQRWPASFVI